MVAHAFNTSMQKADAGGYLQVQGQASLQSEFQESQAIHTNPVLIKPK